MRGKREVLGLDKKMLQQCLLLYIGIWGGLLGSQYLFILLMGYTIFTALFGKISSTFQHLMFLIPFTAIYKLSPTSTSLYTYVTLAVGVILMLRHRRFLRTPLLLIVAFSVYAGIGMGSNYTTAIKMIVGLVLLYIFVARIAVDEYKNQILAFSLGMLGSSVIGMMKDSWERLSMYFGDIDYVYLGTEKSMRFSGLMYDPNYYSISAIMVIFLCLVLFYRRACSRSLTGGIIAAMMLFGLISYSKLFLLAIVLVAAYFVFDRMKSRRMMMYTLAGAAAAAIALFAWADSTGYLQIMADRMQATDISNGRFELWNRYMTYILSDLRILLWGVGLGGEYYSGMGPHNTYMESLYFLGLWGSILFATTVWIIIRSKVYLHRRDWRTRVLMILFLIMIATLGTLTVNDLPFYFMLLWISMNIDVNKSALVPQAPDEDDAASGADQFGRGERNI